MTTASSVRYNAIAVRALARITKYGASCTILADTFRGGSIASDVAAQAVEIPGDPDTYQALNLVAFNPVTLLVAAYGLTVRLAAGVQFSWGGTVYTTKLATPLVPDAETFILWTLVGTA